MFIGQVEIHFHILVIIVKMLFIVNLMQVFGQLFSLPMKIFSQLFSLVMQIFLVSCFNVSIR